MKNDYTEYRLCITLTTEKIDYKEDKLYKKHIDYRKHRVHIVHRL